MGVCSTFLGREEPARCEEGNLSFRIDVLGGTLFWMLPPLLYRSQVQGAQKESTTSWPLSHFARWACRPDGCRCSLPVW